MGTSLSLSQQLKQQLKLSPAQIQVMRMLELPTCELQACINEELQKNPALEEGVEAKDELEFNDIDQTDDQQSGADQAVGICRHFEGQEGSHDQQHNGTNQQNGGNHVFHFGHLA